MITGDGFGHVQGGQSQAAEADHSNCSCSAEKHATTECLKLYEELVPRLNELVALVQTQLYPASSTPERGIAAMNLCTVLGRLQLANIELFEVIAAVEDAV